MYVYTYCIYIYSYNKLIYTYIIIHTYIYPCLYSISVGLLTCDSWDRSDSQVAGRPLDRFSKADIKDLMHGKVGVNPWKKSIGGSENVKHAKKSVEIWNRTFGTVKTPVVLVILSVMCFIHLSIFVRWHPVIFLISLTFLIQPPLQTYGQYVPAMASRQQLDRLPAAVGCLRRPVLHPIRPEIRGA